MYKLLVVGASSFGGRNCPQTNVIRYFITGVFCLLKIKNYNKIENNLFLLSRKNLINQEAKFQSQLNDLTKELSVRDAEATKLRFQMDELQRDVFAKSVGMDRKTSDLSSVIDLQKISF